MLTEPDVAYIVVPSVSRHTFPHTSPASLVKAFGVQVHSSNGSKELCFMAGSVQSKIEWVEEIQKVLGQQTAPAGQAPPSSSSKGGARELKAVSIVPLSAPSGGGSGSPLKGLASRGPAGRGVSNQSTLAPLKGNESGGSGLELSIRSSMLETSDDDSFI